MPAGDRRGPRGMGPMTGRGAGFCAGNNMPGYMNPGFGYIAYGRGAFGGRGHRHWYYATGQPGWLRFGDYAGAYPPAPAPMTAEEEQEMLQEQEKWLQEQLDSVRSQMKQKPEEK